MRGGGGNRNGGPVPEICTVRISGIPDRISDEVVRKHCISYGPVVAIQSDRSDGKYRALLVQLATRDAAEQVYRSPEPVCNNRFIRVDWAFNNICAAPPPPPVLSPGASSRALPEGGNEHERGGRGDRGGLHDGPLDRHGKGSHSGKGGKGRNDRRHGGRGDRQEMRRELSGAEQLQEKRKRSEELKDKQEKILLQRRDALQKQLDERISMRDKLQAMQNRSKKDSVAVLLENAEKKIAELQEIIDKGPEALAVTTSGDSTDPNPKEETPWWAKGRLKGKHSIDNRTTTLRVQELPEDCGKEQLLAHFAAHGAVESVTILRSSTDEAAPAMALVKFAERIEAEKAMRRGRSFSGTILTLVFHNPTSNEEAAMAEQSNAVVVVEGGDGDQGDERGGITSDAFPAAKPLPLLQPLSESGGADDDELEQVIFD